MFFLLFFVELLVVICSTSHCYSCELLCKSTHFFIICPLFSIKNKKRGNCHGFTICIFALS